MNNLFEPAYPFINQEGDSLEDMEVYKGFTKLEKAMLIIAGGLCSRPLTGETDEHKVAFLAKKIAKAVLAEANKDIQ